MVLSLIHNDHAAALVSRQDHNVLVLLQVIKGLDINVQVHMKPFRTLSHLKDHISGDDKSSIVYKINFRDCDASYVERALKTCISEHCRAVEKMDFSTSALAQHVWEHDHHIDWTSTYVLKVESHYQSRLSREAIYIRRQPSSLHKDRGTLPDIYDFVIALHHLKPKPYN